MESVWRKLYALVRQTARGSSNSINRQARESWRAASCRQMFAKSRSASRASPSRPRDSRFESTTRLVLGVLDSKFISRSFVLLGCCETPNYKPRPPRPRQQRQWALLSKFSCLTLYKWFARLRCDAKDQSTVVAIQFNSRAHFAFQTVPRKSTRV